MSAKPDAYWQEFKATMRELVERALGRIDQLTADRDRYRAAIEAVLSGDVPRVGRHQAHPGGPTKFDTCDHGLAYWQDCEQCIDAFLAAVVGAEPATPTEEDARDY